MLDLVIVRHARAGPPGEGESDWQRSLSEEGAERFTQAARGLARLVSPPVEIIASPYLRTRQTAQILREALAEVDLDSCLGETDARLTPEGATISAIDLVQEKAAGRPGGTLLLVSHMPLVGRLAGRYLGTSALSLTTGEAFSLRLGGDCGALNWKLTEAEAAGMTD